MNNKDITILVVGLKDRKELARTMKNLGYKNIIEEKDGTSAWNLLKKGNWVDIIFADWNLGQFDGVVMAKLMMADPILRSIPIILVSSNINSFFIWHSPVS